MKLSTLRNVLVAASVLLLPSLCSAAAPGAGFVQGNDQFAIDAFRQIVGSKDVKGKNFFFSPLSISAALSMTLAGAKGETASQMSKTLHVNSATVHDEFRTLLSNLRGLPGEDYTKTLQLNVANALWLQKSLPLSPAFTQLTKDRYGAKASPLDFKTQSEQARQTINAWVSDATKKKIPELIGKGVLTSSTRLVLTNAMYFKGQWIDTFEKSATKPGTFIAKDGNVAAPFMHQQTHALYFADTQAQALRMGYNGELTMTILLPKENDGLSDLQNALTPALLQHYFAAAQSTLVNISVPKFSIRSSTSLGTTLKAMGMTLPFDPDHADFSGMTKATNLSISDVIHQAFVDVDEKGTEAAAATAVMMTGMAAPIPEKPVTFTADHPFLFVITEDRTNAILFMGRVMDPSKTAK